MAGRIAGLVERLLDRGAVVGTAIADGLHRHRMGLGRRDREDRGRRGEGRCPKRCCRQQSRDHAASDHVRLPSSFL